MPLSDASTTRAPWSAAHAKAAAMSHARPLPDASRARSGTMPAFGAPQVMSPLPWVPSVSARRAAHARSREAKQRAGRLAQETLGLRPLRSSRARPARCSVPGDKQERFLRAQRKPQCPVAWMAAGSPSLMPSHTHAGAVGLPIATPDAWTLSAAGVRRRGFETLRALRSDRAVAASVARRDDEAAFRAPAPAPEPAASPPRWVRCAPCTSS
jgi:hypothetical protein